MTEETIFAAALERTAPADRSAYLDAACAGNAALRRRVEALLGSHDGAGGFLAKPALAYTADEGNDRTEPARNGPPDGGALDFLAPTDRPDGLGRLDQYEVTAVIGWGSMGVVLKAFDEVLRRTVAIKVLAPQLATSPTARKRFQREAQAAAGVRHDHVVTVHAVGEAGLPYLVMEYIDGPSLRERLDRGTPMTVAAVGWLGAQAAEGLAAAHAQGLVHRDVKPANILLEGGDGRVKITDFGLARTADDPGVTQAGVIAGTPRYMAPEQARGEPIDHRADVYSLGATLYELLTGRPPFPGRDLKRVLNQVAWEDPPAPRQINRAVPADLETVVLKAMAKAAVERYGTARELADDLGRFLRDEPVKARRPTLPQRVRRWARRHRELVVATAVGLVVALAVAAGSAGWVVRDRAARQAEADLEKAARQAEAERDKAARQAQADREKAAREAEADRGAGKALQAVALHLDHGDWPKARAAFQRAEWSVTSGGSDNTRQRVITMGIDLRMVERLEEIRLGMTTVLPSTPYMYALNRTTQLPRAYAAAFKDYGIDVAALDAPTAAERIRASGIRAQLVAALDDWMWGNLGTLRYVRNPMFMLGQNPDVQKQDVIVRSEVARYEHLRAVADLAAPDEWCRRVRDLEVHEDRRALVELAGRPEVARLPASTTLLLARALTLSGEMEKPLALLYALQQRDPEDFLVHYELALVLSWTKPARLEEAIGFMRAAVALRPHNSVLHLSLGERLRRAVWLDQAEATFRKVSELRPSDPAAYRELGRVLELKGNWDEAIAAYARSFTLEPRASDAEKAHRMVAVYRRAGRWDKAIAGLREASRLAPDRAGYQGELAWLLATCPTLELRDADEAVKRAGVAVQLDPKFPLGWRALGAARYRAGDWAGTVAALNQPNRLQYGGGGYEWFFLAMAHWRLGDQAQARQWYDRAVRWMQDPKWKGWTETPPGKEELARFRVEAANLLDIEDAPARRPRK